MSKKIITSIPLQNRGPGRNSENKKFPFKFVRFYLFSTNLDLLSSDLTSFIFFLNWIGNLCQLVSFIGLLWFFAFTAQTLEERFSRLLRVVYFLLVFSLHFACFCQRNEYFGLFMDLDKIIEKSKWNNFPSNLSHISRFIEKSENSSHPHPKK